jgi:hypothetical protein
MDICPLIVRNFYTSFRKFRDVIPTFTEVISNFSRPCLSQAYVDAVSHLL